MKRVTKPGGKILIGTITRDSDWGKLYQRQAEDEDSVFLDANFWNPEDFEKIDPANLVEIRECLFIAPDTSKERITMEEETRLAGTKRGGFFCALWQLDS